MTITTAQLHKAAWIVLGLLALFCQQLWFASYADIVVPPETIKARVEQYIRETTTLDEPDAELIVELIRLPDKNVVLEGENLEIMLSDNRVTTIPWRTIVQVTLSTEKESQHIGVPVQVEIEKPVWVTTKMVRAKSKLDKKDMIIQRKLLSHNAGYFMSAKEDVTQYTSLVNIPPGQMLDLRRVKKTPAVYRNDDVRILLTLPGDVKVSVFGLAMEDGAIGDRIRVKHQKDGERKFKVYTGQVIGKNQVLVAM